MDNALKALNEAAYSAARAARKSNDPRAESLAVLARETDRLIDGGAA